ncbi:MAG TPA: choice-of-anchor D domain-containing protein [Pirellulaceae bacterium]|nr:choice-of-anchor D domain-containing protein [Pirellulaceae bacterium]
MRRRPDVDRFLASGRLRRTPRRLKLESLEPRLVLTSLTLEQASGQLSSHGFCTCPVCTGEGLSSLPAEETSEGTLSTAPLSSLPQLRSNPGATAKLFLDFDGHFESSWGSYTNVSTPAFSQDGDTTTFTTGELTAIEEIWARVAEDFAPFNIDVTTIDPGNQTNQVTAVIAIGGSYSDWFGAPAGGVAYIGGFYNSAPNVAYVFEDSLSSHPRYIAEAASHEAGHLFGLLHQSLWNGSTLVEEYNPGTSSWAPIMGNSYSSARTTWFNGATNVSSSSFQNDIAIIAGANNGFGQRADDYGNTIPYAADLPAVGTEVSFAGLIEHNADVDMWEFTTAGGQVSFTLSVAPFGPNLDAILELRSASNTILYSSSPTNSFGASITATLAEGTYYLVARSNGAYGNIGQYSIAGTIPADSLPEISMFVGASDIGDDVYINYGLTGVGAPVTRTFTVRNDGGNTLNLTTLDANAMPAGFTLTSNLSDLSLVNGETATFTVQLDATSAGSFSGQIQVVSNDQDENPFRINVLGTVGIPEISMFAGANGIGDGVYIDYGSTPAGSPLTTIFTVRNDGGGTLNLSPLDAGAMPSGFTLTSNLSSLILLNGQTATFALRLDAASLGSYAGQIQVVNNDSDENPFRINVLGTVVAAPEITVTESGNILTDGGSLSFGSTTVGNAVTRTFTVINDGGATLSLTPLDANSLPVGFSLAANVGSTSLAPGESTTFAVRLDAAAAGSYSGAIALANNDANENPFDLTISGTVSDPAAWGGPKLIDNGDSGWTKVGSWKYVTGKGRENDIHRTAKGSGTVQSNWTFNDLPEGQFWVWASWTGNVNNASNAPFSVYDGTQAKVTWRVDQRTASSGFDADGTSWQYLGMVTINSGKMVVRLTNAANSYVVADAIRMDRVTSQAPLPATSPRDAYFAQTQQFTPAAAQAQVASLIDFLARERRR